MLDKFAIIDLGSNTFHLLIASIHEGNQIQVHYKERVYVKLAQDGVTKIGKTPFERGIQTLIKFRAKLDSHKIKQYKALGTATLRKASNASEFLYQSLDAANIKIDIIEGEEEAKLIYYGVLAALDVVEKPSMIMDIGGGSLEFILFTGDQIHWHKSFPAGVAVLKNQFQSSGALSNEEIHDLHNWLDDLLEPLILAIGTFRPELLIGASGTFEVLDEAMGIPSANENFRKIDFMHFHPICNQVLQANETEIERFDWIPKERKDLIQVAFALLRWIIEKSGINEIAVSKYAMKEGALFQMKNAPIKLMDKKL